MMRLDMPLAAISPYATAAFGLAGACLGSRSARNGREGQAAEPSTATVEEAYLTFFGVYGALQSKSTLGSQNFRRAAMMIRSARHDTIEAMRNELGLDDSARPPSDYNPFAGTDLERQYGARAPSGR